MKRIVLICQCAFAVLLLAFLVGCNTTANHQDGFGSVYVGSLPPNDIGLDQQEAAAADKAAKEFSSFKPPKGPKKVSPATGDVAQAISVLNSKGIPFVRIPANSIKRLNFPGYCMDRNLPAPKSGEEFQLISVDSVIPKQLLPTYDGLLNLATKNGSQHNSQIQGIIWKLRTLATQPLEKTGLEYFSKNELSILKAADPNSLETIRKMYGLEAAFTNFVRELTDPNFYIEAIAQGMSNGNPDVEKDLKRLFNMPVPPTAVASRNAGYTKLGANVVAHASSPSGGLDVQIDIANTGNTDSLFLPQTCVAQSTRPVQRVAIQSLGNPQSSLDTLLGLSNTDDGVLLAQNGDLIGQDFFIKNTEYQNIAWVQVLPALPSIGMALRAIIAACTEGAVLASAYEDLKNKKLHRGRIQAQGGNPNVEKSVAWNLDHPLTLKEGLEFFQKLKDDLTLSERNDRKKAIASAERFMYNAAGGGGTDRGKSFLEPNSKNGSERIDIEVIQGYAFVP